MDDAVYDMLEARAAQEDGFFVRDYVYQTYLKGTKTKNSYIEKIKKKKVEEKLKKLNDNSRKDSVVTFEQLGTDKLFVDEAHRF